MGVHVPHADRVVTAARDEGAWRQGGILRHTRVHLTHTHSKYQLYTWYSSQILPNIITVYYFINWKYNMNYNEYK